MDREPIKISWDELKSQSVEERLREQRTVNSTKEHYERADVVAPKIAPPSGLRALLMSAMLYLAVAGVGGGFLGWGAGEILNVRPDRRSEAQRLIVEMDNIARNEKLERYTPEQALRMRQRIARVAGDNPYFAAHVDASLSDDERAERERVAKSADRGVEFRADLLLFAVSGCFIAIALAVADRIVERDWPGATVDAAVGAVVGIVGGLLVAAGSAWVETRLFDVASATSSVARIGMRAGSWALLGAAIGIAPGLATRSGRRIMLGAVGGLAGGLIGGLAFEPLASLAGEAGAGRLIALVLIGAAAGLAIGWLENVAKQGWLRVASGLIAGKQFILYRNPTFIGSAPMSHIYLFRDAQVGRRHAAIYHVPGGFEVENLPLGGATLVNGEPITRHRLRSGDRVTIGRTTMLFEEKAKS